jgi:hypothetical protein
MSVEKPRWRWIVLIAFLMGVVCHGLSYVYGQSAAAHSIADVALTFLERLGDAFLVAVVLALLIERTIGDEHFFKLIAQLFGRNLPPELARRLHRYFEWDFVRKNWSITYTITHMTTGDLLQAEIERLFTMENRSNEPKAYTYKVSVEQGVPESTIGKVLVGAAIELGGSQETKDGYVTFTGNPIELEPSTEARPFSRTFGCTTTQVFRGDLSAPYWALHPVIGATFTVYYPEDCKVEFDATFQNTVDKGKEVDEKRHEGLFGLRWSFTEPFLPGQGFHLRCVCTKVSGASGARAPESL